MKRVCVFTLALAALVFAGGAQAAITLNPTTPTEREPVEVTVTDAEGNPAAGAEVSAGYGPGSNLARTVSLGAADSRGRVTWTPEEAGIVSLSAELPGDGGTVSQNVSVQFTGPPGMGVLVMMVAGLILYGGVVHGFTRLKRLVPELPPDT